LLADGRRQIIEFCYSGDFFGLEKRAEHFFSAEAVNNVVIMRYPRRPLKQLLSKCPHLMYVMHHIAQRDLANAQMRIVLLGRMNAAERVATFLFYMLERSDTQDAVDLPMSRGDIADYLGLTIETVSRVITAFKRTGIIGIPQSEHIELRDRSKLQSIIASAGYSHLSFSDDDSRPLPKSRLPMRLSGGIDDRPHRTGSRRERAGVANSSAPAELG
jgi:CRP-like cAMP-binding protein